MNSLKQILKNQVKRKYKFISDPLKAKLKSNLVSKVSKYAFYYKHFDTNNSLILYESRDGKSMTDSPYAVFLKLLSSHEHKDLTHVWVADSKQKIKAFEQKMNSDKQTIKYVIKGSDAYLKMLATAKYLVNNSTFPNYFSKKPDQVYVNTWHGTPIKAMGLDMHDNLLASQNVIKNFLSADIIVSPNTHTTNIFKHAYKLEGLYNGEIAEIGYPRIDLTINSDKSKVVEELEQYGIQLEGEQLLVFAPTWRGNDNNHPEDSLEDLYKIIESLSETTRYKPLIKVHPFIYDKAKSYAPLKPYLIPDAFDTNRLLSVTDVLVTDYSSIFFDYLVTGNPIIFYAPDFEAYKHNRGLYIDTKLLPGPTTTNAEQLIEAVKDIEAVKSNYQDKYANFQKLYVPYDDGNVTDKLIEKMFKTQPVHRPQNKENILIYPGGMINNGITSSMLNLLENIDYTKYDVTLFLGFTNKIETLNNLKRVNPNVRIILRQGPLLATTFEKYQDTIVRNRGLQTDIEKAVYPKALYEREFRKIFGRVAFDTVIDFSGYSMFWSKILLGTASRKKLIYLHSDMENDMNRTVNGVKPHYQNLKGVMSLYYKFDYLVSVSEETKRVNQSKISTPLTENKFVSAMNVINLKKIHELSNDDSDLFTQNNEEVLAYTKNLEVKSVPFNKTDFKIMAMGRLSPEKGFDILISAFYKVNQTHQNSKLYILGEGPLRNELQKQIERYDLQDSVFLLGQKSNPFYIMKQCDLFALTSHYEGQSMVLLEALTLGKHIIASDIPANRYVLQDGALGLLTENTIDAVAENIEAFIKNEVPEYGAFNYEAYNKEAIEQFYQLLK